MTKFAWLLLFSSVLCLMVSHELVSARIVSKCEAVKTMIKSKVGGTFLRTYTCIMMHESRFDTSKKTGPGHKASYSHGVFQISSDYWCNQFRPGGQCSKKCTDFLDDDIRDDIECAKIIQRIEGFKRWKSFNSTCKNIKNHPSIAECRPRHMDEDEFESDEDSEIISESEVDVEKLFYNKQ